MHWPGVIYAVSVIALFHWVCYLMIRIGNCVLFIPLVWPAALGCVAMIAIDVRLQLWLPATELPGVDDFEGER